MMKSLVLSLLIVSMVTLATPADGFSLHGRWHVNISVSSHDSELECTFSQEDGALSGTCVADKATLPITGKVEGNKVAWSYQTDYEGSPLTVEYEGTAESADKIKGNVNVVEMGVRGDFYANPSK